MKHSISSVSVLLAISISVSIFSCKSDKVAGDTTRKAVNPQLTTSVPFRDFEINAESEDTVRLAEGTNIYIPTGIFLDEKGTPVKGKIQLHYRAFYTPGEIIASGITMQYDTAGVSHLFASAGMFEMTGTQDGKPVSIAPNKSIKLDFASNRNDTDYSFYHLDTASCKWDFLATTKVDSNKLRLQLQEEIDAIANEKPVEPKLFDAKKPVIDIDVDVDNHPELSGYNGIVWQYAGQGNDPEKNQWIYSANWSNAKLEMVDNKTATYLLRLTGSEKNFTTQVIPTFKGSDLTRAMDRFKARMEKFIGAEKVREEKEKQISNVPQYQRPVAISRLGIHNCDMFYALGIAAHLNTEFHFDDPEFEKNRQNVTVYVISASGRISVGYNALALQDMIYLSDKDNCLIAVLKGTKKAATLSSREFSDAVISKKSDMVSFKLQPSGQEVSNSTDIDTLLHSL